MDKLDLILQKLDEHDKQFNSINATLNQQSDMLTQLINIVAATNQKVSEQSNVNESVTDLKSAVRFLNHRVADVELDIETIRTNQ